MQYSQDATIAINDYVDRVRAALPLSPSARLTVVDRLYHDIRRDAEARAQAGGQSIIGADVVRDVLASLGTTEQCAQRLASNATSFSWQWPGDAVADAMRRHRVHERVDRFARVAAEQGERVAQTSIDAAAQALELAAQKLKEVAEKLNAKA